MARNAENIMENTFKIELASKLPHEQRVIVEANELGIKTFALKTFIDSNPIFEKLEIDEKNRLHLQYNLMKSYWEILEKRIQNFKDLISDKREGLTFEAADRFCLIGLCIALPEWEGFWFRNIKTGKLLVFTKEKEILDTPSHVFKLRNDWMVVKPNEVQEKLLEEYLNKKIETYSFGGAIVALKRGQKVARKGWNGAGMFLYLVPGSTFKVNREPLLSIYEEGTEINYRPHIDLKTADGSVATWSPSGSDALAEDWIILD